MMLLTLLLSSLGALLRVGTGLAASYKIPVTYRPIVLLAIVLYSAVFLCISALVALLVRASESNIYLSHETLALLALAVPAVVLAGGIGAVHRKAFIQMFVPEEASARAELRKPTWRAAILNSLPALCNFIVSLAVVDAAEQSDETCVSDPSSP
jgi:hypothetical protein